MFLSQLKGISKMEHAHLELRYKSILPLFWKKAQIK